ncbi:uncharacterized protein AMSG_08106 [Thecamonas trahens ATCC 50062]|uniref:DUF3592 domain-containing protein n=1 Tax=Thecamonas trahens ATCC 50062 TaxID=461836 RepID=A0A0L0DJF3_THETB|nr:hypothetical protein AMSG_08106 [Thecamonas trahens ATCC 50062]KNC52539.1 hypothetical protein AMSG_08106 [Thecamonas trahens ATCC 50062]|eukprot:XP_013755330.1 hypothetical protein AMSG_08106 [Thecamonas trahens ATCC 50062]
MRSKRQSSRVCNRSICYRAEVTVDLTLESGQCCIRTTAFDSVTGSYTRGSKTSFLNKFDVGSRYPCWYDEDDPSTVILEKKFPWAALIISILLGLWLLISFCVFCIGGIGTFCDCEEISEGCDACCPCWDQYDGCVCPSCAPAAAPATTRTSTYGNSRSNQPNPGLWMESLSSSSEEPRPYTSAYGGAVPKPKPKPHNEPLPSYTGFGGTAANLPPPPAYDDVVV